MSVADAASSVVLDDRPWVARDPEAFGISSDGAALSKDAMAQRLNELEGRLWRIALEVRAAGVKHVGPDRAAAGFLEVYDDLAPRQREILDRLLAGERVAEIARAMFVSPSTVRNHLTAVYRRFGVHSQLELMARLHPRSSSDLGS